MTKSAPLKPSGATSSRTCASSPKNSATRRRGMRITAPSASLETCSGGAAPLLAEDCTALLPHELRQVVGAEAALVGDAGAFPAAEALNAGPRAGRRAGGAVRVEDARLRAVEEELELLLVARVDPRREPVDDIVAALDRLAEI